MASNDSYYCNCARHCKHHKKIPEFPGGSGTASSSLGTLNAGAEALKRWLKEEDVESKKHQAIDMSEEADLQDILENDLGETFKEYSAGDLGTLDSLVSHTDNRDNTPLRILSLGFNSKGIHMPEYSPPQDFVFAPSTNVDVDFEPAFDKLKTVMDFIKAIRATTLDNGDLSKSVLLWL
ncbi:hypothetical protein K439DRAFT_1621816 [Ramaria rubella]|nr:hypothetical protein K439DRAFT_1621816 [Ramaria rubella]